MSSPQPEEQAVRIQAALRAGHKIEAIALYRELTGVGLAEAKAAMDALERKLLDVSAAGRDSAPSATRSEAVSQALLAGRKIEAIKLHRGETGASLAEAKAAVESIEAELRAASPERFTGPPARGCLSIFAFGGAIGFVWRMWGD